MTVSTSTNLQTYAITVSTSSLAFTLPLFTDDDLEVLRQDASGVESTLAKGVGWSFTPTTTRANDPMRYPDGGTINLLAGPYTDGSFVVRRQLSATQPSDYPLGGSLSTATLEASLDRLTFLVQQVQEEVARAVKFPETETGFTTELVTATNRASKALTFSSSGAISLISAVPTGSVAFTATGEDLVEAATPAAARAVISAQEDVITTRGDVVRGDSSGAAERLAIGAAGLALVSNGTDALYGRPYGIVQRVSSTNNTYTTFSGAISFDDTIPQSGEGTEIITASITPTHASNSIVIEFEGWGAAGATGEMILALFQDSATDALQAARQTIANVQHAYQFRLRHVMTAGTTSATTFKLHMGPTSGTGYLNGAWNGSSYGRQFGGTAAFSLTVTEVKSNG